MSRNCRSKTCCAHCQRDHHRSLCPQKFRMTLRPNQEAGARGDDRVFYASRTVTPTGESLRKEEWVAPNSMNNHNTETGHLADDEHTVLKTALVDVSSTESASTQKVRMFLDSGCSRSYITEKLAKRLKLRTEGAQSLTVNRFGGGSKHTIQVKTTTIVLRTIYGRVFRIKVAVTPDIMNRMTKVAVTTSIMKMIPTDIQLADTPLAKNTDVDIDFLLGNDYYDDFVTGSRMDISAGFRLISSEFGWIMTGRVPDNAQSPHQIVALYAQELANLEVSDDMVIEPLADDFKSTAMEDLWRLETLGITDSPNPASDDAALEQFNQTVKLEDGRYQVTWPWRANAKDLPSNYRVARRRLETTVNRIRKSEGLIQRYDAVIQDQLKKSVIEEVDETTSNRVHYLPHREVLTPQKETTKLRIVYDASARAAPDLLSLNDCLHRGLIFMTALLCLLMRFMLSPIMVISDIEKAFLQVGLQEQERDVTRFLWLRDISKPVSADNLVIYRFTRVTFGMSPSPFLLGATIVHHLRKSELEIARLVEDNTYVDNVITGFSTLKGALQFYDQAKSLFSQASMNLREFACNSPEFMSSIPEKDRAGKSSTKVLGIGWDIKTDELFLNMPESFPVATSKRQVMRGLLKVYDPLGWLSPVIIRSRLLMQRLCKGPNKHWNDPLTEADVDSYNAIIAEYEKFRVLRWPRYAGHGIDENCRLMCFCDASQKAYATVVYLQYREGARYSSRILFAKARVSPMAKSVTIPRMELLALLIGVRAVKCIREYLDFHGRTVVWSDSQCVLKWLGSNRVLGTFVDNRLKEIRKVSNVEYKYVPTAENPADLPSRGVSTADLTDFWWKGPSWSLGFESAWPNIEVDLKPLRENDEEGSVSVSDTEVCLPAATVTEPPFGIDMDKYSNLGFLLRVTAYCQRVRQRLRKERRHVTELVHQEELRDAELQWIRYVQGQAFADLQKAIATGKMHPLRNQLGVVMDSSGVLRCAGRMGQLKAPNNERNPILLPSEGKLTKLLIWHYHRLSLHGGRKIVLNTLRRKYWILRGATTVWTVLKDCSTCLKVKGAGFARPAMPDLPAYRVNREFPFQYTGIDYFGPMKVRLGEKILKNWGCIFTCLTTRAVHLELVGSLSANDFLLALRRFSSRRGRPKTIVCDNGSQFCAIKRNDVLSSSTEGSAIEWQFITALSPWKGGVYERLIASVKASLRKSIGKALLSGEQLATLLTEVEYTLNSRPLTTTSEKETDVAITPNDLLGVVNLGDTDEPPAKDPAKTQSKEAAVLVEMFRKTRNIVDEFWRIWQTDYLNELRESHRLRHKDPKGSLRREPKVGELVLVKEAKLPKNQWRLAVVQDLHRSRDQAVRAVTLRLSGGSTLNRPVNLICPLEVQSQGKESLSNKTTTSQSTTGEQSGQSKVIQTKASIKAATPTDAVARKTSRPTRSAAAVAKEKNRTLAKQDLI